MCISVSSTAQQRKSESQQLPAETGTQPTTSVWCSSQGSVCCSYPHRVTMGFDWHTMKKCMTRASAKTQIFKKIISFKYRLEIIWKPWYYTRCSFTFIKIKRETASTRTWKGLCVMIYFPCSICRKLINSNSCSTTWALPLSCFITIKVRN